MGTDNLHGKRKARKAKELERKFGKRKRYEKVLIVCEGSKTEPIYFNDLISHYKLSTANVIVDDNKETCPFKLLGIAKKIVKEHDKFGSPFDKVYCVFDKDSHSKYDAAKSAIESMKGNPKYYAITSVPSFEYWLLLHFRDTVKPYKSTQSKSIGDLVYDDLRKEYPKYCKACIGIYSDIQPKQGVALDRASRGRLQVTELGTDNPSTKVDILINELVALKSNK
ncbi:RloB family protein [Shewanella algae]|uniref:RloB family protein n=1 Tax=Shewanella algae TaxID=38313 RepID=UPI001F22035C|nr:RloB family protein [Shewanella algae]MCE9785976.1 RloB family protein [Shewanella algae]WKC43056.1 RloB family protein [Shewanella algae]